MKKILAVVLTALILLTVGMTAFAEHKADDHDDLMFYRDQYITSYANDYKYSTTNVTHNERFSGADVYSGIDISSYQENVDWAKVKADGVNFVILRLGYRGYTEGKLMLDTYFQKNITAARAAGLEVGVYFFTQAITVNEAIEEADFVAQNLKNYSITMPVFYDIEDYPSILKARMDTAGLTKTDYTAHCLAFCRRIERYGYKGGVYANKYWLESRLNSSDFSSDHIVWLAHYTTKTSYAGTYSLWQTSESSVVNGVNGRCDFDYFYAVKPNPLSNVSASVRNSTVSFSFDKDLGIDGYEIYRYDASGAFKKKYDCKPSNVSVSGLGAGRHTFMIYPYYTFCGKQYKASSASKITATVLSGGGTNIPATEIDFNTYMMELNVGTTGKINASLKPYDTTDTVTWTSSNPNVATVVNGIVTARSAGSANITGRTTSGYSATCAVIVKPASSQPTSVKLNVNSLSLGKGETYTLKATVAGGASSNVSFYSSNTSVASVTGGGIITARGIGTATVTASASGKTASCVITVKAAPTSISLGKTSMIMGVGEQYDFNSTLNSGAESRYRAYRVSDSSVASITTSGGIVTAKKTGTVTVTVTCYNGVKASCKITVRKAPSTVTMNKASITLGIGEQYTLEGRPGQGTASYYKSYKSSNTSVVSVSPSTGLITARGVGQATVTVSLYNGVTGSCIVTVKPAAVSVSLNKTSLTLGVGEQFDLDSKVQSGGAAYLRTYKSDNTAVASVAKSGGLVTAKAVGQTTVTVYCFNGVKATCTVTVKPAVSKIVLNKSAITLGVGEQFDLDSTVNSGAASYHRDYTTGAPSIVSVQKAGGLMTALRPGNAVVTVTCYNGVRATCLVTVKPAPSYVALNAYSITLRVGQKYDLDSYVNSGAGANKRVYTSNDPTVATVAASGGIVTARKRGRAVITLTCYNGVKNSCIVNVV